MSRELCDYWKRQDRQRRTAQAKDDYFDLLNDYREQHGSTRLSKPR